MKFSTALVASLAVHGLLAVGVVAVLRALPTPEVTAQLDLSSVELSFAETEDATAAIRQAEAASVEPRPVPQPQSVAPAPTLESTLPSPPAAAETKLPEMLPRELLPPPTAPQAVPEAVAPQQAKIEAPPRPQTALRPKYPAGARRRGEQGEVVLELVVDAHGRVEAVAVAISSGFPALDAAAVAATKTAAFTPARSGGRAVPSTARLTVSFRLNP